MEQQEQIFQLYIQQRAGLLSAEEQTYVEEQLAQNGDFKAIWEQLEQESDNMKLGEIEGRIDPAAALEVVKYRMRPQKKVFTLKKLAAAAAVLALIATGGYLLLVRSKQPETGQTALLHSPKAIQLQLASGESVTLDSAGRTIAIGNTTLNTQNGSLNYTSADTATNTLWVPAGENYRLVLSDGTEVWLNSATKLTFPFHFGKGERKVQVEGEAYFKVAKNASQPFVVYTPLTQVQVLGTSFNVNTYQYNDVKTALVEGSVITRSSDGQKIQLSPGQESCFKEGKGFSAASFDKDEVLSWLDGVYYYHEVSLPELATVASRFYGVNIHLDKGKYANITVTGLMDRAKLNEFLSDLQTTARISFRYNNNEVYLQ